MEERNAAPGVIASIRNSHNSSQVIEITYLQEENGFATSGIRRHFDEREILIPAYLVVKDIRLMGAIVSAILERLSQAQEAGIPFTFTSHFEVLGQNYEMRSRGEYLVLEVAGG